MRLSCKQADRIFWGISFCRSLKLWQFGTSPWFNDVIWEHAGKMSVNAHGLFWATGKKKEMNEMSILVEFEVFTKNFN